VKRRIMLAAIAIAACTVMLLGVPLGIVLQQRQSDETVRELTQLAALAAAHVDLEAPSRSQIPAGEPNQLVAVYDAGGTRLVGTGPSRIEPSALLKPDSESTVMALHGDRVVVTPVLDQARTVALVRVSEPLNASRSRVWATWAWLGAGAVAVVGVVSAGAAILVRRLTRPLDALRSDAARIGDGDFTVRPARSGVRELDQVGDALASTAVRIGGLVEREQAFSSDASHQLRTPLAGLRLTLESELAHPQPDPARALQNALSAVDRLEATIGELLDLARDTSAVQRPPIDLVPVVDEIARRWRPLLAQRSRPFRFSAPQGVLLAKVSATAVGHVVDVLIDNAREHGRGAVELTVIGEPSLIVLAVADEGPGIVDATTIFERRNAQASGSGIGLALARRLIAAEGGRLEVAPGAGGSRFEITIPRWTDKEVAQR
jgi:signal transduction histidine kinase